MDLGRIDLDHTLSCGQAFRWKKVGEAWEGVVDGKKVRLGQRGRGIEVESDLPNPKIEAYFRADDDYERIIREISKERYVAALVRRFPGLRLLRQDPWECSASYILATFSNIPRIKGMIERICVLYGEEIEPGLHAFPKPKAIAEKGERAETCGLGFRCKRFVEYAARVDGGEVDFEKLRDAGYDEAHKSLVKLEGIGDKVADCVAVFSLDHLEAFPIDVRIGRMLKEKYGVSGSYGKVSTFAREHFGQYAGYSQEFIYYAADRKNLNQN
jgi:N-glycosylase/DNA lyase